MNADEIKHLSLRLVALTELLEERARQAVTEVALGSDQLQSTARSLGLAGRQLADEVVGAIGAQAQEAARQGLRKAIDPCSQGLLQAVAQAERAAAQLQSQGVQLLQAQRGLLWKGSLALLLGAVLAMAGSGYVAWKSAQAAAQAEFSSSVLRALQSGVLTQCGNVLCVKAPRNAGRYEKNNDYILLRE